MSETPKLAAGETLELSGRVDITAAGPGEGKRLPQLSIDAYNGGVMRPSGLWGNVVVDLSGIRVPSGPTPILLGHDHDKIVGHATVVVTDRAVLAEGVVSGVGQPAVEFVASARNGFPWRASIGLSVERSQYLDDDEEAVVNGRMVAGPVTVVRQSLLGEISLLPWPADSTTTVSVAARKNGANEMGNETIVPDAVEQIRAEAENETRRIGAIREICSGQHIELEAEAIRQGWDAARTELEVLRAERQRAPVVHSRGEVPVGNADALAAGLLCAAGQGEIAAKYISPTAAEQGDRMKHWRFLDFAKATLTHEGRYASNMGPNEMLRAAFSTMSLPTALGSATEKSVQQSYENAPSAWRSVCDIRSVRNFKTHTSIRLNSLDNLIEVGPTGEISHVAETSESTYTFSVKTFAKMISITRANLIDDDLGLLQSVGPALGRAAARSVSDLFATTLLANASSFFAAGNNNYFDGAATNLQSSSLGTAVGMLRTMKDVNSHPIDMEPRVLLVPATLEVTARELLRSREIARDTTTDTKLPLGNVWNDFLALSIEPRLGMTDYTGYSTTAWYLWSAPSNGGMIAAFLNGRTSPVIETTDADFNTLGIQMRVYFDYGFKLSDPYACIKSKGAA